MTEKLRSLRNTLEPHQCWLMGLRWIGVLEIWPAVLACVLIILALVLVLMSGPVVIGMTIVLAHLILLAVVVAISPRWLCSPLLGTLCISLLNYCLMHMLISSKQQQVIAAVYCGFVVIALAYAVNRVRDLLIAWRKIASYDERDDFRWLLTEAPLLMRWRMSAEIRLWRKQQLTRS